MLKFHQIQNKIVKAERIALCSNSPLGSGNKKHEATKAFDELYTKLVRIYNS